MKLSFKTCVLYLLWFSATTTSMQKAKKSGREPLVEPCCHSNIYNCHPPPHFRNCGVFVLLLVQQWSSFSTSTSLLVLSHQSSLRLRSDSAGDSPLHSRTGCLIFLICVRSQHTVVTLWEVTTTIISFKLKCRKRHIFKKKTSRT